MPLAPPFMNTGISASRLAPAENTSSGDQITRPLYSRLGQLDAPSAGLRSRAGLIRCSLAVMLAISTSPSSVQTRTSSFLNTLGAGLQRVGAPSPTTLSRERLALVHRQRRAAGRIALRRRSTSLRPCARRRLRHRPVEHPVRQRRLAQRLAGVDVVLDPLRHLLPAGRLPDLERALAACRSPSASRSRCRVRVSAMSSRCTAA